jgi:hypothetical protein
MSHNKFTVGSASPDTDGDVTLTISNLSDVNVTNPSAGQVLAWSGSAWENAAAGGGAAQFMLIGQGESNAYSNATTATSISAGGTIYLYDTNPVNTISGSSITNVGATDWVESITLPAGNYILMATYAVEFSATGHFSFIFKNASNSALSGIGAIGEDLTAIQNSSGYIQGYTQLGSSTTIKLHCNLLSNVATVANQGNTPAEQSSIMIWKV